MASQLGNVRKAYIKVSGTLTWLTGEQNNSVEYSAEAVKVVDKSSIWASYLSGEKDGTINITVYCDNSDASQVAAFAAFVAGTEVDYAVGVISSGAISDGDYGTGIITSVSDTNDYGAVSTRNIVIQNSGAPTHVNP